MVADTLSRKTQHELSITINTQLHILRDLENMSIELVVRGYKNGMLSALKVQPFTVEEIKASQKDGAKLERFRHNAAQRKSLDIITHEDGT